MSSRPGASWWMSGLLGVLLAMTGCSLLFSAPSVTIVGVDLVSLGLVSGTAEVTLDVTNEGSRKLDILGLLYALEVRDGGDPAGEAVTWRTLAEGTHAERVAIDGKEIRRISLPVPFEYRALGAALRSFLSAGEVPYRIRGEVTVRSLGSERRIPFRSQGILR